MKFGMKSSIANMKPKKIVFVCLGNICRSPSAEGVFKHLVEFNGVAGQFEIDSAGTNAYYVGEGADRRMISHAAKRGYNLTSKSRKFNPNIDFDYFDMIIGMDNENISVLKSKARTEADLQKIYKMTDFRKEYNYDEIPDPYYGGAEGFELVLDLLEDACEGLLEKII
jgi:protein-tyrosine phosphatase